MVRRQGVGVGHELHDEGRLRRRLQLFWCARLLHEASVEHHHLVRNVKRLLLQGFRERFQQLKPKSGQALSVKQLLCA